VSANSTSIAEPADPVRVAVAGRVALAAAVLIFAWTMLSTGWEGEGHDVLPTIVAGRLVATDRVSHLYPHDGFFYNRVGDAEFGRAAAEVGSPFESTPFVYPPLVAHAMQFASTLQLHTTMLLWTVLSTLLLLIGFYATVRVYLPDANPAWLAAAFLALCAFEPLLYGLWLGQTTSAIFALTMGAIALQRQGRLAAAAVCLALAAYVKLTPLVLAVVWIWRGPRRAAIYCAVALVILWGASFALMGVAANVEYLRRVDEIRGVALVAFNNHSLLAFLARFEAPAIDRLHWRMLTPGAGVLAIDVAALAAGAILALAAYRRVATGPDAQVRPLLEAFALLAMLLAPNIAWTHYFVFLIPVAAAIIAMRKPDDVPVLVLLAVAIALCSRPLLAPQNLEPAAFHNPLLLSLPTFSALLLFAAVLRVAGGRDLFRSRARAASL
jgi:alpha-1,2-mannosyltransferase